MNPAWHFEVQKLRAAGLGVRDIAKHLGRSPESVRYALDEHGERNACKERLRKKRQDRMSRPSYRKRIEKTPGAESGIFGAGPDVSFIAPHVFREVRRVINREAVLPAARAFAFGLISREELIAAITP